MDLVDIDKVLDDLELNEDNTCRPTTTTATVAVASRTAVAEPTSSKLPQEQQRVSTAVLSLKPVPQPTQLVEIQENGNGESSNSNNNITISADKTKLKTNVINVSTVFSSLNEYVNAGTDLNEKLQQAEIQPQTADSGSTNGDSKPLISPSISSVSSDSRTSSSPISGDVDDGVNKVPDRRVSTSSNSSEPENHHHHHHRHHHHHKRRNSSCSSSASSTRSTPSSSSSSTSTSDGEEDVDEDVHERLTEGLSLSAGDYILDSSENTTLATTNEEQPAVVVSQMVPEEKKAGPSEQQDTSAFSYKNSLYSDTLSNDVINLEGISSISSIVAVDLTSAGQGDNKGPEEVSVPLEYPNKKEDAILAQPEAVEEERTEIKKVVGFESTMDDVSDTELESYLQELEEYDIQQTVAPGPNTAVATAAVEFPLNSVEVPEEKPLTEEKDRKDTISIGSHNSIDTRSDESIPESNRGDNDEDLISQASTLEFNDLAAMNAANGANVVQDINVDDIPDNDVQGIDQEVIDDGSEIKFIDCTETESAVVREDLPVAEEAIAGADNDEARREPPIAQALAAAAELDRAPPLPRPNSLELNSHVDTLPEKQSSPGHTPPSSMSHGVDSDQGLTLSSTSSDDFAPSIAIVPAPPPSAPPVESSDDLLHEASGGQAPFRTPGSLTSHPQLGKIPPYWVPDNATNFCMQCNQKFSLIKRRHHCRACGQLLCSACCCLKAKLQYMGDVEARVCISCDIILNQQQQALEEAQYGSQFAIAAGASGGSGSATSRQPNPNNPMEYCSTVPPFQQAAANNQPQSPISVMVPVGVLKRAGAPRSGRRDKTVIFSDGIRPGCDLTELDESWDTQPPKTSPSIPAGGDKRKGRVQTPVGEEPPAIPTIIQSLIPSGESKLPPIVKQITKTETKHIDVENDAALIASLRDGTLTFALQTNLHVLVTIVELSCCINKTVINFTTRGMHYVGQDEVVILLELGDSQLLPKDIFLHLNDIYLDADRGSTVGELGYSPPKMPNFLGSKNHGGFLYVRPTYQCMQNVIIPDAPYLVGVLIHRWEVPWAKVLPLRLMLRLGALYRYYPSPHVSVRERESVYVEIAQTVMTLLADFRNYSYTIPTIRGMVIHIEDRKTSILIPRNRYEQVMKVLSGSSDQTILALGGNFSKVADGHLVCIQNTDSGCPETAQYSTQAINIEGQPRKVTGASFLVLNGILKANSGLIGKCSIVEDGLMVQVPPAKMNTIKDALKNMKDYRIVCGPVEGDDSQKEIVSIEWTENDLNFNIGVLSPIDKKPMNGIPSIRVHRGTDYSNANHIIRWTEVFIIQGDDESNHPGDPINMSKLSEQIAKSACTALVAFLDLLASNGFLKIGLRVILDSENVSYEAGSQFNKLGPLYMNALDNELIGTLNRQANSLHLDQQIIVELVFHILNK